MNSAKYFRISRTWVHGAAAALAAATTTAAVTSYGYQWHNSILCDTQKLGFTDSVQVDSSVNPFPAHLRSPTNGKTEYTLVGHGVRKVTFLKFRVYALGVYVANEDCGKIARALDGAKDLLKYDNKCTLAENVANNLQDKEVADSLIESVVQQNVKFLFRIVPLRDTDFNHLRDGFIRSSVRNKKAKSEHPDELTEGVNELRSVFVKYKSKCPKNHVLNVETDENGGTTFVYENLGKKPELGEVEEKIVFGTVKEPVVTHAILSNYFTKTNPISSEARDMSVKEFANLLH